MKVYFVTSWICLIYYVGISKAEVSKGVSSTKLRDSRSYDFPPNSLPLSPSYQKKFYGTPAEKVSTPAEIDSNNFPKYDIPSGFDKFVPGKSNEYNHVPLSLKSKSDYLTMDLEKQRNREIAFKLAALKRNGMNALTGTGNSELTEKEDSPTFLSGIKKMFSDPVVAVAAASIPLFLVGAMVIPLVMKMLGSLNRIPAVTTTVANNVARSLDGGNSTLSVDRVLNIINEYGARSMEDPRCVQRFLCQAMKSDIQSRSDNSWSVRKFVRKLTKSVNTEFLETTGLQHLFKSVQNGNCDLLECSGSPAYTKLNLPLLEKIIRLGAKLYSSSGIDQ